MFRDDVYYEFYGGGRKQYFLSSQLICVCWKMTDGIFPVSVVAQTVRLPPLTTERTEFKTHFKTVYAQHKELGSLQTVGSAGSVREQQDLLLLFLSADCVTHWKRYLCHGTVPETVGYNRRTDGPVSFPVVAVFHRPPDVCTLSTEMTHCRKVNK